MGTRSAPRGPTSRRSASSRVGRRGRIGRGWTGRSRLGFRMAGGARRGGGL